VEVPLHCLLCVVLVLVVRESVVKALCSRVSLAPGLGCLSSPHLHQAR